MRLEAGALFLDRAPRGEAEHLIAAAIGQDRARPPDETVQAAASCDEIVAGPQIEVVGVAEQDLRAEPFEIAMSEPFHRALGADRHERRRLDASMRSCHHATPRAAVRVSDAEIEPGI